MVLVGAGIFWLKSGQTETGVRILSGEEEVQISSESGRLVVDVAGAVSRPGVYELKVGSRVDDALAAAGGIGADADNKWVEVNLNRSAKVADGMKIFIPRLEDQATALEVPGKVNINSADSGELDGLPGIGPAAAAKIIGGRPYTQADELLGRKIVSAKVWEQIKELVTAW